MLHAILPLEAAKICVLGLHVCVFSYPVFALHHSSVGVSAVQTPNSVGGSSRRMYRRSRNVVDKSGRSALHTARSAEAVGLNVSDVGGASFGWLVAHFWGANRGVVAKRNQRATTCFGLVPKGQQVFLGWFKFKVTPNPATPSNLYS